MTPEKLANTIQGMNIHQRIRARREALGLSMEALAARVGVVWQTVQQWEKESMGTAPSRKRLTKVAEALETTPEYLMLGDEYRDSNFGTANLSAGARALIEAVIRADQAGEPEETFRMILRLVPNPSDPVGRLESSAK